MARHNKKQERDEGTLIKQPKPGLSPFYRPPGQPKQTPSISMAETLPALPGTSPILDVGTVAKNIGKGALEAFTGTEGIPRGGYRTPEVIKEGFSNIGEGYNVLQGKAKQYAESLGAVPAVEKESAIPALAEAEAATPSVKPLPRISHTGPTIQYNEKFPEGIPVRGLPTKPKTAPISPRTIDPKGYTFTNKDLEDLYGGKPTAQVLPVDSPEAYRARLAKTGGRSIYDTIPEGGMAQFGLPESSTPGAISAMKGQYDEMLRNLERREVELQRQLMPSHFSGAVWIEGATSRRDRKAISDELTNITTQKTALFGDFTQYTGEQEKLMSAYGLNKAQIKEIVTNIAGKKATTEKTKKETGALPSTFEEAKELKETTGKTSAEMSAAKIAMKMAEDPTGGYDMDLFDEYYEEILPRLQKKGKGTQGTTRKSKPTFEEFRALARRQNSKMTDVELMQYYEENYRKE